MGTQGRRADSRSQLLDDLASAILATVDMQEVLTRAGGILRRIFGEMRISIHRVSSDDPGTIEIVYVYDPRIPQEGTGRKIPIEGSLCGEAVRFLKPVFIENIDASNPHYHEERFLGPLGYKSLWSFPLIVESRVLGTLDIVEPAGPRLLVAHLDELESAANILAIALNNSLMVEEVKHLNRLLHRENQALKLEVKRSRGRGQYVAESPLMLEVMRQARLVAASDATVLLRGETGTGKEGLARLIHEMSPRKDGPFVATNLASIPETLIESELFGHEKGSFTGAHQRREGFFETAAGGTLFLDEIGDAPLSVQTRLMRALQEKEFQRVGSSQVIRVDVRVIAATHRPLERMVEESTFRSDLYFRLNIFPMNLPPLRERKEDIRPLAGYFLARYASELHRRPPILEEAAIQALESYSWPGNVRELENTIARAMILSPGNTLVLPEFPPGNGQPVRSTGQDPAGLIPRYDESVRNLLRLAMDRTQGRIYGPQGAAALLGLKPTTLQGKLRKYRLVPHNYGPILPKSP
jgi:formate hydrogenlyase transcriptional activator